MYLAMDFFRGRTLNGHIPRVAALNYVIHPRYSLAIKSRIDYPLYYARRSDSVHRDINPDNVLLELVEQAERPGELLLQAVVTNFRLGNLRTGAAVRTQDGPLMITMPYLSPDQSLAKASLTGAPTSYVLGVHASI